MIKRILAIAVVAYLMPVSAFAAAWTLNTWVKTSGGNITVGAGAPQTSSSGSVFKSYTTSQPITVKVNATTGYSISSVNYNGVTTSNPTQTTYTVQGPSAQNLYASFAAQLLSVTASTGAGGTVSPTSRANIYYGQTLTSAMTFTFSPSTGFALTGITGVPAGATVSSVIPAPVNSTVTVTFPAGFTFTGNVALSGTFAGPPVAIVGPTQTVYPGAQVTLDGSLSTGAISSWLWSQTSGPGFPGTKVIADNSSGVRITFPVASAGTYTFSLTVTGGSTAYTTVNVSDSAAAAARNLCANCHLANGVGAGVNVYLNWSSSLHRANYIICSRCHVGTDTGSHPGPALTSSTLLNVCNGCHVDASGNVPLHPVPIGANVCSACHDPHSTVAMAGAPTVHFNTMTSAGYPASYMTSRSVCENCHTGSTQNQTIRHQWGSSGHAAASAPAFAAVDFKTRSGCVQCHTTTGFIAYSTGRMTAAWGDASDKTKELITCIGCHSDVAQGTVRNVSPVKPFANDGYQNRNVGASNVCMNCHSGRNNGASIQLLALSADFTNLPFVAPHAGAAGATLHGVAGYHFPGQSYAFYSSNTHRQIGMGNLAATGNAGPCVGCHMSSTEDHTYQAVATDAAGAITGISSTACVNCHGANLDVAALNQDKGAFQNALNVLKAQLAAKGFSYASSYPYFTNTNWGVGQAGANVMGAAFNYVLLANEPGIYAHNPAYARQLLLDSIDFLDNGQMDGSAVSLAAPNLVGSGSISQSAADAFTAYQVKKDACLVCHGGSASSASPMATRAHPGHLTAAYGPGAYLGTDTGACQACHGSSPLTHLNGVVDVLSGAGSSCQGCHAGAAPPFASTGRLDCLTCHAVTPAVLPNGVAAPYKGSFASSGHGQFPASNACTVCHDPDSSHISGSLGTYNRLRSANDNNLCATCHNSAAVVGVAFRNMSTHVTKDGRSLGCVDCHDPHGTANLSMIRATINGSVIVFTDAVNGLVDTVSNRGLCQVCHTQTIHYRAGVPETNHYASGCLNCHRHNSAGGAFRPVGGSCDSCHGYPPAPRTTLYPFTFGVQGSWSSARFEDYSGGGGAHLVAAHIDPSARPTDGWSNCTVCHNGGASGASPYHKMTTPVAAHVENVTVKVDQQFRFSEGFAGYSGAKLVSAPGRNMSGSCFNLSCHMSRSPRWSVER